MVNQENFRFCQEVKIRVVRHQLLFRSPAKTSRDTLTSRDVYYIILEDHVSGISGIGECAPIWGLSTETKSIIEESLLKLESKSMNMAQFETMISDCSSIHFALETALLDLKHGGKKIIFPDLTMTEIPINGLVWMNSYDQMFEEAVEKISQGYTTVKFKVGAIKLEEELALLAAIREKFKDNIDIRIDANGAFDPLNAKNILTQFSSYGIHSIEQPIKAGQWEAMSAICEYSPIDVALDEELIGIIEIEKKKQLLDTIKPAYLVLKPTLHGGFSGCDEWITLANERNIKWWTTSALESNIGLNALAQWAASKDVTAPQGLGTGSLYVNNIPSPCTVKNGFFYWDKNVSWDLSSIL